MIILRRRLAQQFALPWYRHTNPSLVIPRSGHNPTTAWLVLYIALSFAHKVGCKDIVRHGIEYEIRVNFIEVLSAFVIED